MAKSELAAGAIGAYEKTLTANTVDEVDFPTAVSSVEIISDGTGSIFVTIDGSNPTVGGAGCFYLPPFPGVRTVSIPSRFPRSPTVVKLISVGTPTYSVAQAD